TRRSPASGSTRTSTPPCPLAAIAMFPWIRNARPPNIFFSVTPRTPPSCSRMRSARSSSYATLRTRDLGQRVAEERGFVLGRHEAKLVVGHVTPMLLDDPLGVGPGAVAVRVVDLEHHVLHADAVAGVDRRRVIDRAEPEVALDDVGGPHVGAVAVGHVLAPV